MALSISSKAFIPRASSSTQCLLLIVLNIIISSSNHQISQIIIIIISRIIIIMIIIIIINCLDHVWSVDMYLLTCNFVSFAQLYIRRLLTQLFSILEAEGCKRNLAWQKTLCWWHWHLYQGRQGIELWPNCLSTCQLLGNLGDDEFNSIWLESSLLQVVRGDVTETRFPTRTCWCKFGIARGVWINTKPIFGTGVHNSAPSSNKIKTEMKSWLQQIWWRVCI